MVHYSLLPTVYLELGHFVNAPASSLKHELLEAYGFILISFVFPRVASTMRYTE